MTSLPDDVMKKLQDDYLVSFEQKINTMRDAHTKGEVPMIKSIFHKLAGTGATYLMPEITTLGRAAELYIEKTKTADLVILGTAIEVMNEIFEKRKLGMEFVIDGHPVISQLSIKK